MNAFEKFYDHAQEIATRIFEHPELGYKEIKTSQLVEKEIHAIDPSIKVQHFCKTGIKVAFDNGKEKTLAFVAELDAVYVPGHFCADKESGAAHACGHFTQTTVALSMMNALVKEGKLADFGTNLTFVFVPAEEYVDLAYREDLRDKGEIVYYGGKPEAMRQGVFDDIDLAVCIHAIGEKFSKRTIEINCDLAGFAYKYYDFKGRGSHAGFDPFSGINAYSISTLFNTALGLSRQQVKATELIRFNPVIMDANMTTNVIPDHVRVGTDVRYMNMAYGQEILGRIDQAAVGCAKALGGSVDITTEVGYLPFIQNRPMNEIVYETYQQTAAIEDIITDRGGIAAAGDIGDLGYLLPSIQISHGGFEGAIHGVDFQLIDSQFVLQILPEFVFTSMENISNQIERVPLYKKTFAEYEEHIQQMGETTE